MGVTTSKRNRFTTEEEIDASQNESGVPLQINHAPLQVS